MVSQCKICGARTAGHRQYCPDCRREYKGRYNSPSGNNREISIIVGIMFILFFMGFVISELIFPILYELRILLVIICPIFIGFGIYKIIKEFKTEGITLANKIIIIVSLVILFMTIVVWKNPTLIPNPSESIILQPIISFIYQFRIFITVMFSLITILGIFRMKKLKEWGAEKRGYILIGICLLILLSTLIIWITHKP